MKLLSMWEPWASLLVLGKKRIETRGWGCPHRGWTAIHACRAGLSNHEFASVVLQPEFSAALSGVSFSRGCIIGIVQIIECLPTQPTIGRPGVFEKFPGLDTPEERAFGDFSLGRYGFVAGENPFRLPHPIPFASRPGGFLDVPDEIVDDIRRQWKAAHQT